MVFLATSAGAASVTVRETTITIPTYLAGEPDPNPMFYFGRNSQGAEGRVYPYPLYDSLTDIKSNKTYKIIYLENEFVRIGVLPEIGGRLFEAIDKSNGYNWVYRQHVIKPALIGLIGAWMSGGIEWNIPHHHRATTFLPVQYRVEENADGSKTIWVGELEIRQRMRWAVGYTLSPGKSYLTAKVRIINRTPLPNTMLCFANLAVHASDQYQIIFPPDTQFVTYHGKREFATWPIATGRYAGADFGSGTDVSWYTNHLNANSMFAWNYEDDFFAGYDHGKEAGTMSVADHRIVPGKKFWTWGNGPRGKMWDKILTDDDGPYIELMVGAYSDNQPDYSWLQPFETKSFEMHWYPFRDIGGVKNANLDAAVNLEATNGVVKVGFCTTAAHRDAKVIVTSMTGGPEWALQKELFGERISISPGKPFVKTIAVSRFDWLSVSLTADGRELVRYLYQRNEPRAPLPNPVESPLPPADIKTVEELYLAGQRIEQFHDPGREPEPYWEEALRRDPGDARVNTALGIRQLKQARFAEAEQHFRKAIERLTANYTSPKDGEPFYYLGVALKAQHDTDEAVKALSKAAWSQAWRGPAYFELAEIAAAHDDLQTALEDVDHSLDANPLNLRALTLKATLLRRTGRNKEAVAALDRAQQIDPLDLHVIAERRLSAKLIPALEWVETIHGFPNTALETAVEFAETGFYDDATEILKQMTPSGSHGRLDVQRPQFDSPINPATANPLAWYCLAKYDPAFSKQIGPDKDEIATKQLAVLEQKIADTLALGAKASPDYWFPFEWENIQVLRDAMRRNTNDANAPYFLGNLLFDWQPEEATKLWEQSAAIDPSNPIVHRNLAVAYSHRGTNSDPAKAIAQLELAVAAKKKYAMHFTELDELYADTGKAPERRLALLEKNQAVVSKRDDSLSREIGLKVFAGKYDEAIQLMTGRKFSVWEGGTLDVAEHWVNAHLLRGRSKFAAKDFKKALADFQAAKNIPDNLPSDRGGARGHDAEIAYWTGLTQEAMGDAASAKQSWQEAAIATGERGGRRGGGPGFGPDRSIQRYYQALAQKKLGQSAEAETTLKNLLDSANRSLTRGAGESPGGFAERQSPRARTASAHYLAGLAHLGLGETAQAKNEFSSALEAAPDSLGAKVELARLP